MKIFIRVLLFISAFTFAYSATTIDDCMNLRIYFGLPHEKTADVITEYKKRIETDPDDHYAYLALGVIYTALASTLDGPDKSAVQPAIDYTDRFLLTDSNQVYAICYNALDHGLRAKYSHNVFEQLYEIDICVKKIEKAFNLAKNTDSELFVRLTRGCIDADLPDFFNKRKQAIADFTRLESAFETNKNLSGEMIIVYYYLGELAFRKGDIDKAREYWQKSIDMNQFVKMDFAEARLSQKRLDEALNSAKK